jgi:hypothetical protein
MSYDSWAHVQAQAAEQASGELRRALDSFGTPVGGHCGRDYCGGNPAEVDVTCDCVWVDWVASPFARTRDSDIREESNFETVRDDLTAQFGDRIDVMSMSHWGCGWVEHVVYQPTSGLPAMVTRITGELRTVETAVESWAGHLSDYLVADEADVSNREWDSMVGQVADALPLPSLLRPVESRRAAERVICMSDIWFDPECDDFDADEARIQADFYRVAGWLSLDVIPFRDALRWERTQGWTWPQIHVNLLTLTLAANAEIGEDEPHDSLRHTYWLMEPNEHLTRYLRTLTNRLAQAESANLLAMS